MTASIGLDLPSASSGKGTDEKYTILSVQKNGQISLNDTPVELQDLDSELRKIKSAGNLAVKLRADKAISFGQFVSIIDVVRNAGATEFQIDTQPE